MVYPTTAPTSETAIDPMRPKQRRRSPPRGGPMEDLEHDISLIQEWAAKTPIIERVWIFGSRVCGTHHADSDLDVAIKHAVAPGAEDLFTTGLCEPSKWRAQLQPHARLQLDIQSYIPGDTPTVEAGLRETSRLIYRQATPLSDDPDETAHET